MIIYLSHRPPTDIDLLVQVLQHQQGSHEYLYIYVHNFHYIYSTMSKLAQVNLGPIPHKGTIQSFIIHAITKHYIHTNTFFLFDFIGENIINYFEG